MTDVFDRAEAQAVLSEYDGRVAKGFALYDPLAEKMRDLLRDALRSAANQDREVDRLRTVLRNTSQILEVLYEVATDKPVLLPDDKRHLAEVTVMVRKEVGKLPETDKPT